MDQEEKKYRRISMVFTAIIQVVVLALVYVLVAWREPDPPIPEYGIELSFGLEQTGVGESVQQPEELDSEVQEEPREEISEPLETPAQDQQESVQEVASGEADQEVHKDPQSPDVVEEEPAESQQEQKSESTPVSQPSSETEIDETLEKAETKSQGNKEEEGVQGDPEVAIDERALYGEREGTTDGASLELTGWAWDFRPDPKDESDETGKIVFEIKIDDQGYLVSIKTLTSTVTPRVENIYRRSVEQLTFSKTSEYQPAPFSTGKITFLIKSK